MLSLNYSVCFIIISYSFFINGTSLLTENNELKTIDILRQQLNQETLFRIALTKDFVKLKEHLDSKQDETKKEDKICSKNIKVIEEGIFNNSLFSLVRTIAENVSIHKIEEMSNETSLQMDEFTKLSDGIIVLLNHFESMENFSYNVHAMQNKSEKNQFSEDIKMFSTMLLKGLERLENVSVYMIEKLDALNNDISASRRKSYSLDGKFRDCEAILNSDVNLRYQDGVYQIYPDLVTPKAVFCDMSTSGGGWTVIQGRFDGSTNFQEGWEGYKVGFGNPYKEYWLGDMMIKNHNLNGMHFTTRDRDNDRNSVSNCAVVHSDGWWYNSCGYSDLNGIYRSSNQKAYNGQFWGLDFENMKSTRMMLRSRA